MKKSFLFLLIILFAGLAFYGCEDRSDLAAPSAPSTGTANFARYVAIGNSITAGYQNGAVYQSAQMYSYGNLIAGQVGTTFAQPLYSDPGSGGRIEAKTLFPSFSSYINPNVGTPINLTYSKPYNNLGVPGAAIYDFVNAYDSNSCFSAIANPSAPVRNPFFNLVLRNQGGSKLTQWDLTKAQQPTFVTFWLGNNDILGSATNGVSTLMTPLATFAEFYNAAMDSLKTLNVPVVVANIPDVTILPFFTTVGGQLLQQGVTSVVGTKGDGSVALLDLTKNFITLKGQAELEAGKGTSPANPLSNGVVLDSAEIVAIKTATAQFNGVIQAAAAAKDFGFVDANAKLNQIAAVSLTGGYEEDGITLTVLFVTGNLFSLDGVHPTSVGHALMANEFIKVINTKYNASIPRINLASVPGSVFFSSGPASKIVVPDFKPGTFDRMFF